MTTPPQPLDPGRRRKHFGSAGCVWWHGVELYDTIIANQASIPIGPYVPPLEIKGT